MTRPGRYTSAAGRVEAVQFALGDVEGLYFLTLSVRPDGGTDPGDPRQLEAYQIDGATLSIDGRPVGSSELLHWLVGDGRSRAAPRVKLAGQFGTHSYPVCDSAEFFSEAP